MKPGMCKPTTEDIAEHEVIMKLLPVIARVKRLRCGEDWQGATECPVCGGKLYLSHAALNGHVCGRCEIENCIVWME